MFVVLKASLGIQILMIGIPAEFVWIPNLLKTFPTGYLTRKWAPVRVPDEFDCIQMTLRSTDSLPAVKGVTPSKTVIHLKIIMKSVELGWKIVSGVLRKVINVYKIPKKERPE